MVGMSLLDLATVFDTTNHVTFLRRLHIFSSTFFTSLWWLECFTWGASKGGGTSQFDHHMQLFDYEINEL